MSCFHFFLLAEKNAISWHGTSSRVIPSFHTCTLISSPCNEWVNFIKNHLRNSTSKITHPLVNLYRIKFTNFMQFRESWSSSDCNACKKPKEIKQTQTFGISFFLFGDFLNFLQVSRLHILAFSGAVTPFESMHFQGLWLFDYHFKVSFSMKNASKSAVLEKHN